jgi:flavin reductase
MSDGRAGSPGAAFPPGPTRRALRSVLGRFASGVTVVAVGHPPCGMTANSFTSVSLDPPLVLVCVNRDAALYQAVLEAGHFTVSVLSAGQEPVARYFADHGRPRGAAEFGGVDWLPAPVSRVPVLRGALAWLDCSLAASYDGGDHAILLGNVLASGAGPDDGALLFYSGHFYHPELGPSEPGIREAVEAR